VEGSLWPRGVFNIPAAGASISTEVLNMKLPVETFRILKRLGQERRKLAVEAQRVRLLRSIVLNEIRRKGL